MPFDGLVQRDRLLDLLTELGITPVPTDVLTQHKHAEVLKHPASRLFRYPGQFQVGSLLISAMSIGLLMSSVTFWTEYVNGRVSLRELMISSLLTAISFAASYRFHRGGKGPATWVEIYGDWSDAPTPIRNIAERLVAEDPKLNFVFGTLMQDKIDLDPYLMVEKYNPESKDRTRACLGIWDGTTIIQIAREN